MAPQDALYERTSTAMRMADGARRAVGELQMVFHEAAHTVHPAAAVEVLQGAGHVVARVRKMITEADGQVRTFDTPPYAVNLTSPLLVAARPGVVQRSVYDRESVAIPGRLAGDIAASRQAGEFARIVPHLPLKLLICDEHTALVTGPDHGASLESAYIITKSSLLDGLQALFERYWAIALPMAGSSATHDQRADEPDPEAIQLLTLLLAGHTDASLARSLGVSPRTAQRRVGQLMAELNAQNRFQAGAAAALRGWL